MHATFELFVVLEKPIEFYNVKQIKPFDLIIVIVVYYVSKSLHCQIMRRYYSW